MTIGEDATRIICSVEYDSKTNRCVGFVLPLKGGLPVLESFLAISFDAIQVMFGNHAISRYAYVYMVQPLDHNVPPFCLACFGTNNKFTRSIEMAVHYERMPKERHMKCQLWRGWGFSFNEGNE